MTTSGLNLAQLITPFSYQLSSCRSIYSQPKLTTWYDKEHLYDCKDMLELILRANYHDCDIPKFVFQEIDSVECMNIYKYASIVHEILTIMMFEKVDTSGFTEYKSWFHRARQYTDIGNIEFRLYSSDEDPIYVVESKQTGAYVIVAKRDKKLYSLGEISEWQAQYVTICRAILLAAGGDNRINGTVHEKSNQLIELYEQFSKETAAVFKSNNAETTLTETKATNYVDIEKHTNSTAANLTETKTTDSTETKTTDSTETKTTDSTKTKTTDSTKTDIENYKKLISERGCGLFEEATHTAIIQKVQGEYILVNLGIQNTLVFRADFSEQFVGQLEKAYPCDENLSNYVVDDVKIVAVNGDDNCFSYVGFKYNNILYKILACKHKTMLSCMMYLTRDGKLSKDLLELSCKIFCDIGNLPEIKYCEDASIAFNENFEVIKILHGPNEMFIYHEGDTASIKYQKITGKYNGKPHLFIKIGRQTYKIKELNYYDAACTLIRQLIQ